MLFDVVYVVGGCEDFRLVDIVYADGFEDLLIRYQYIEVSGKLIGQILGIQQSGQFAPWP